MVFEKNSLKIERFGTCSKDCYGSCVFLGEWNDRASEFKFITAKPSKQHPFTSGFFCNKYAHREKLLYHPQRIKKALVRNAVKGNNQFDSTKMDKALDIISKKTTTTINKFGSKSILVAFNAGNNGMLSKFAPLRFFSKLGTTITTGGICNEGGCMGLTQIFGTYSTTNPLQILNPNTKLIVIWGSDLSNRNIHAFNWINKVKRRGVKLIVVHSRKTEVAEKADLFIYTKPGSDHFLASTIIKRLIQANCIDQNFLINHVEGYNQIKSDFLDLDLKNFRKLLGIKSRVLQQFVDLLKEFQHHTIFNVGYSVQKQIKGGQIVQSIALIQILLGNFGKPGTGLIYSQSDFNKKYTSPLLNYITQITEDSNLDKIELISLGKNLSSEKYKIIFIYNFNPASSLPNQNQIRTALMRKDLFVVVLDYFLNETTKYADVVIPAKFDLETFDLFTPYYVPGISINQGGPCPYLDCVSNYEFFQKLAWKMGLRDDFLLEEDQENLYKKCLTLLPSEIQKIVKKQGFYLLFDKDSIPFNDLNFPTSNGRINVKEIKLDIGINQLEKRLNCKKNEFLLISPSHKYYLHSQFGRLHPNFLDVFQKVFLNSYDIQRLGYKKGERVLVSNELASLNYILAENNTLPKDIALIFSGSPLGFQNYKNVNSFISDQPEELGHSGTYNSAKIFISKLR